MGKEDVVSLFNWLRTCWDALQSVALSCFDTVIKNTSTVHLIFWKRENNRAQCCRIILLYFDYKAAKCIRNLVRLEHKNKKNNQFDAVCQMQLYLLINLVPLKAMKFLDKNKNLQILWCEPYVTFSVGSCPVKTFVPSVRN